jgi:hypothetical protein
VKADGPNEDGDDLADVNVPKGANLEPGRGPCDRRD